MTHVTHLLSAIEQGDPQAAEQLLPLVYDELRKLAAQKMAREKPGQTLDATALVHEAYVRLVGSEARPSYTDRRHFFATAATAMRRILTDSARRKRSEKHGGGRERVAIENLAAASPDDEILAQIDRVWEQTRHVAMGTAPDAAAVAAMQQAMQEARTPVSV